VKLKSLHQNKQSCPTSADFSGPQAQLAGYGQKQQNHQWDQDGALSTVKGKERVALFVEEFVSRFRLPRAPFFLRARAAVGKKQNVVENGSRAAKPVNHSGKFTQKVYFRLCGCLKVASFDPGRFADKVRANTG
jgi:hypothetical protein